MMRSSFGVDFSAAADVEGADVCALAAEVMSLDHGASFDVQHRVAENKHSAAQRVNIRPIPVVCSGQDLIRGDGILGVMLDDSVVP